MRQYIPITLAIRDGEHAQTARRHQQLNYNCCVYRKSKLTVKNSLV